MHGTAADAGGGGGRRLFGDGELMGNERMRIERGGEWMIGERMSTFPDEEVQQ